MKISLVRHFKVDVDHGDKLLSSKEYIDVMTEYDSLDVIPCEVNLRDVEWNKCYSSNLPRAIRTAETIYDGHIIIDELIREVDIRLEEEIAGEYNYMDWTIHSIFGWLQNKDYVSENIDDTRKRVIEFLDLLEKNTDNDDKVILVCHGLVMRVLEEELRKRGFRGDTVVSPDNGDLYLLTNN